MHELQVMHDADESRAHELTAGVASFVCVCAYRHQGMHTWRHCDLCAPHASLRLSHHVCLIVSWLHLTAPTKGSRCTHFFCHAALAQRHMNTTHQDRQTHCSACTSPRLCT